MAKKIIVIAREIFDTRDLVTDVLGDDNKLKVADLTTRFEPEDLNALEMALKIKDNEGATVVVLSLGKSRGVDVLRESLYRGVDDVIRLEGFEHQDAFDTTALAALFAAAITKIGDCDLVMTGIDVVEGENAILGAQIAQFLNLDHVSYVDNIESAEDNSLVVKRAVEMGYEMIRVALPAVINVGVALLKEDPRTPRSAKAMLKLKKKKVPIATMGTQDLGIDNPISAKRTGVLGFEKIPQRIVESKNIDPQDATQLKNMLNEIMKGA